MRFIYVMNEIDRDTLTAFGYKLLKADEAQHIYTFENQKELKFDLSEMEIVFSDTLTF